MVTSDFKAKTTTITIIQTKNKTALTFTVNTGLNKPLTHYFYLLFIVRALGLLLLRATPHAITCGLSLLPLASHVMLCQRVHGDIVAAKHILLFFLKPKTKQGNRINSWTTLKTIKGLKIFYHANKIIFALCHLTIWLHNALKSTSRTGDSWSQQWICALIGSNVSPLIRPK